VTGRVVSLARQRAVASRAVGVSPFRLAVGRQLPQPLHGSRGANHAGDEEQRVLEFTVILASLGKLRQGRPGAAQVASPADGRDRRANRGRSHAGPGDDRQCRDDVAGVGGFY